MRAPSVSEDQVRAVRRLAEYGRRLSELKKETDELLCRISIEQSKLTRQKMADEVGCHRRTIKNILDNGDKYFAGVE